MEKEQNNLEVSDSRNFDLSSFSRAKDKMIATNENSYKRNWDYVKERTCKRSDYSADEISAIISSGSLSEQQKLSRTYFDKDGYYKQIVIYYATLLKYMGLLIPHPSFGKNLSTAHIQKRYYSALDYVEKMQLPILLTELAQRALVDGSYYGILAEGEKNRFVLIDLPSGYACSRFKDDEGNDIVEFDLTYFRKILDKQQRKSALAAYPKVVQKAWKEFDSGKRKEKWVMLPPNLGVCFPFFDGRPLLLNIIPASLEYDEAVAAHREREAEEIRKIIVQKIPHLNDGRLLFEPDEAEEMHTGTVGMMKGNRNISVLTTYGDVDSIVSSTNADRTENTLTRIEQNIYSQAGVTGQIFASTGSSSLETSLNNDLALMMYLANKFSRFVTKVINNLFSNANITFKYQIMPVSHYNSSDFIEDSFKLLGSGYSALIPSMALGLSQRDLIDIKDLENDVLKIHERLKPLATSYTQSGDEEGGRPSLDEEEKSDKTHKNEESLDRTGGGS